MSVMLEKEGQTNRVSSSRPICWQEVDQTTTDYLFPPPEPEETIDGQPDTFEPPEKSKIPITADVRILLKSHWPNKRRFCRPTRDDVEQMTDMGLRVLSVFAAGPDFAFSTLSRLLHTTSTDMILCLRVADEIHGLSGTALRAIGEQAERPEDVPQAILDHVAGRKAVLA